MRLHIEQLIEYGGFSRVYVARVTDSKNFPAASKLALKKSHVTKHVHNPMLRHEASALLLLREHPSIPDVYAWGRSQYYEYLALELLGPSVSDSLAGPPLTLRNFVAIICQMCDALEHVHSHHIIHGDIKPGNFLFGTGKTEGRIYLIDFGLAKSYINPATSEHIEESVIPSLRGTDVYASLNIHYHCTPSRRDDIESLAYSIIKLLRGALPWKGYHRRDILAIKSSWSGPELCAGYPPAFGEFLEYARKMSFSEKPDYKRWREAFLQLVPEGNRLLYDPSDRDPPYVGPSKSSAYPSEPRPLIAIATPPSSKDSEDLSSSSNDHWIPTSSWPYPATIKQEDLFGDEEKQVAQKLERFEEPPQMDKMYLETEEAETMV